MCTKDCFCNEAYPASIEEDLEAVENIDQGNLLFIFAALLFELI